MEILGPIPHLPNKNLWGEAQYRTSHPDDSDAYSTWRTIGLTEGFAKLFPIKGKVPNSLVFERHLISVGTTQLCCRTVKIAMDST